MSNDMRPGWFAVKRGVLEHELFKPDGKWSRFEAWTWMIESAALTDRTVDIGGKPHEIHRGQLSFSERFMAEKWGWSQKAVQNFLAKLKAHGAISISVAKTGQGTKSKRTQITLCNFDRYQASGIKTESKGNQNGIKEEQVTNIPPSEDAASPVLKSVDADPINKAVWDFGVPFLQANGVKSPRPIIGGWLRDHPSPMAVLEALRDAQKAGTADPVPYIKAVLQNATRRKPQWHRGQQRVLSNGRVQEFDGQRWDFRNDLTAEDVAHAV